MRDSAIYVAHILFAATSQGAEGVTLASAVAVSLGIVIQNIPEGAINFLRRNTKVLGRPQDGVHNPQKLVLYGIF